MQLKLFLRLARLHFLIPGFMLYFLGYMLAILGGITFDFPKFLFGYLIFGAAHLSVSFSNDYFDRYSDRNSIKTTFSGGSKVLVEYPNLEKLALKSAIILLCFSTILNLIFMIIYDYSIWFFIFGLIGGLLGWFYTAPPIKFAYRGLGEIVTMLAVGFFMPGMGYFIASGTLNALIYLFVFPLSCYGLFFIITVELPDIECDTFSRKNNLVVKLGINIGKFVTILATFLGTISILFLLFSGIENKVVDLIPFAVFSIFPLFASISSYLWKTSNRKFLVKQTLINMASMIFFLFIIDMNLFFQYIW